MNLFQIKSKPEGIDRMVEFLRDNFVSIGWDELGDLENQSVEEIEERLAEGYGDLEEEDLPQALNTLYLFAHTIRDGDYILVQSNETVYLGDVGDYYYVERADADADEKGMCHRRGVTWLNSIPRSELNAEVQALLRDSQAVSRFEYPITEAGLERWAAKLVEQRGVSETASPIEDRRPTTDSVLAEEMVQVDVSTIEQALEILKTAMQSEDTARRERAAIAILQYVRPI